MESLPREINFLDATVKRNGNKIETGLFCKPPDSHQSCYWDVYKKSIAHSYAIRIFSKKKFFLIVFPILRYTYNNNNKNVIS